MADKKQTHETLIQAITDAESALAKAKADYKDFCKENPLKAPRQPTLQELRLMREKLNKATVEDHQKANQAAASQVQKQAIIDAAKSKDS